MKKIEFAIDESRQSINVGDVVSYDYNGETRRYMVVKDFGTEMYRILDLSDGALFNNSVESLEDIMKYFFDDYTDFDYFTIEKIILKEK